MRDYTPKIRKADLIDGAYYRGRCRHATEARWNGKIEQFVHWRNKFGYNYLETIRCPEDEHHYDVFEVEEKIDTPTKEIPI